MADKMELTEALNQSAGRKTNNETDAAPESVTKRPAARQDKRLIGGHFDKEVHHQVKLLALERDCSVQTLLGEALDLLFVNEGKPPIANIRRD